MSENYVTKVMTICDIYVTQYVTKVLTICDNMREKRNCWSSHLPANVNNAKPLQPNARRLDFVNFAFKQILYKHNTHICMNTHMNLKIFGPNIKAETSHQI